ncbi:MAG: radical SAM protein [Chloroflexi bacterium]|nr:radical SAM protein [Chloroflexota bacterium]
MTVSPVESLRRHQTFTTDRLHSLPMVVLMAHSRCNCRCMMCDIWLANANKRELTRADLEPHVASLRNLHVQRVVLSGGEALMHSNLWLLCELLRELPTKITLLSTGLLLKHFADQVVEWCDDVVVSLDGSREVHNSIRRVPRAFERLAEGIAALRERRPGFPVSGRCVLQRTNFRDLPNIIDAAHAIGLDRISFMAVDVSSSAFNRPIPWEEPRVAEVALDREQTAEFTALVEETICRRAADFTSGFVAENPDKLRRLPRYFAALHGENEFPATVCNAPWVSTVVETDGDVRPCFFHKPLGNIHERPLETILNSPEAIAFRKNLDVNQDPTCRACVCTLSLGRRTPA